LQTRRQNEDDNKPSTIEERRTSLKMIWNDLPQKPVARVSRTLVSDCKHACSRLADTLNILC